MIVTDTSSKTSFPSVRDTVYCDGKGKYAAIYYYQSKESGGVDGLRE